MDVFISNHKTIKEKLGIEKFENNNILIDADDKLPDDTFKNVVILMACITKDQNRFYPNYFQMKHYLKRKKFVALTHFSSF